MKSLDIYDNDNLDFLYEEDGKLIIAAIKEDYHGGEVHVHVGLTSTQAARLSRILAHWAETGELNDE